MEMVTKHHTSGKDVMALETDHPPDFLLQIPPCPSMKRNSSFTMTKTGSHISHSILIFNNNIVIDKIIG